jgi:two-component system CheB/CheR fusion protein
MAFVVIVHLDPTHKSHMAELLQRFTKMPVHEVLVAEKVEADHVYIIPPDKDLTLADGHFRLLERATPNRTRAPIDGFFRTLAETHSTEAIAIVLSGTGSDGANGISWIKEGGGLTLVQTPEEAEYRSMPDAAIATNRVDVVLPVSQLGPEVVRIWRGGIMTPENIAPASKRDEVAVRRILALIRASTTHDFSGYKGSTVNRRIRRRAELSGVPALAEYIVLLEKDPTELRSLYEDLLISVTSFFRDADAFAVLEKEVIPKLFEGRQASDTVRVWVTGCATGEEAYSIAILLHEQAEQMTDPPVIQIFATDVHEQAFAFARAGLYPKSIDAQVSPNRLARFFTEESGAYRVKKVIREKVVFAAHNLLKDPPFLRLDLVTCRNVLIYLRRDTQKRLIELFHFALRPGGYLFLGTSESVEDASQMIAVVDKRHRIYRSLDVAQKSFPQLDSELTGDRASAVKPPARLTNLASSAAAHRLLLEAYAPPSLVVTRAGDIVHLSDTVGQYLHVASGPPTRKLLDMIQPNARSATRKLLFRVFATNLPAEAPGIVLTVDGVRREVDLIARPLTPTGAHDALALIVFDERTADASEEAKPESKRRRAPRGAITRPDLERELMETRSQLTFTIKEHEGTIEELKASNEELQSINEEQKATEEELEASKEELQSINEEIQTINQEFRTKNDELGELNADLVNLIDSTDIATIFLDRNLAVRRFTPAVSAVFNLRSLDIGRPLGDLTHCLRYDALLDDANEVTRTLIRIEREVEASDDRWYAVRISPYRSLDDRIDGVVMTFIDTTGRKLDEVERERLLTEVQSASVAKSNFIGVMSHELRTPLNAIVGYADILAAGAVGPVSDLQTEHLNRIKVSAWHLTHMIDDSLQSVRIEAGLTTLDNRSVDVGALVCEVAKLTEPLMHAKGLILEIHCESGPPIIADATRIRQILFNLIGNAARYTDNGTVSISCNMSDLGAEITIEDTGIGISNENLEKIFERFWQVDQTRTRLRGGTGLGLMVSRSLARAMGGELDVTSELGKGSRFIVRLPMTAPQL